MFRIFKKFVFILRNRLSNRSRVSFSCYIKNPANITLGKHVKIHSNTSLDASSSGSLTIGDRVILDRYAYINASHGGVSIGAGSAINNFSVVNGTGGVEIGKNVLIGPNVQIISYQHNYQNRGAPIKQQGTTAKKIEIQDDVWIGASAVILAGVVIGQGSVIGAGSVVTRSCEPYSVLAGVPARVIKERGA
jgi:acetyltransferase-like isoleucine patch superfamily enzyme